MNDGNRDNSANHVAIVGMAGRFPGARNLDEFWSNLRDGVESISFFRDDELLAAGIDSDLISQANYVKAKGLLEDAEFFDAGFFGFSPREADILDPQHRVFLESAWEALESGGYDPDSFPGPIGVFGGVSLNSYAFSNLLQNAPLVEQMGAFQLMLGNDKDFLATRVSYKLNLKGPSVLIQSACSTSLVAVQFACQSLLDYQCDMALAGGVSITFPRKTGYVYEDGMILSPDGHCRAFDANAMGTIGGEGAGVVLLKRLEDALQDGDHIRAVILGGAINNDGSGKIGYTAPSVDGQTEVIAMAHALSDIKPESIGYIETHGTGTRLGDPIEIAGLTQAFRMLTDERTFCAIGSLKTNIGHLDAAAGVAGLIKTVLALENRQIPPSLHFEKPNPEIDFAVSPFYVNVELSEWQSGDTPRRAGVSSFGIGGTNAHVVVQEAPMPVATPARAESRHIIPLTAMTKAALEAATMNLVAHLRQNADLDLADVAYTLQVGRRHFAERKFVTGSSIEEVADLLESADGKQVNCGRTENDTSPVAFLFTGQGSQYSDMTRNLYDEFDVFREHLDICAEQLRPSLNLDIREVIYPHGISTEDADERLKKTSMAQAALFAIEYAMAKQWIAFGVQPNAMLGHSIGEYVAACLAGVFSLEDGLKLIAERGRLMQSLQAGSMLVVPMDEHALLPFLGDDLSLAAVNGPSLCVVSGEVSAASKFEQRLAQQGVEIHRLQTSHAFHSTMMEPIVEQFAAFLDDIELHAPKIPILSNVSGTWLTDAEAVDPCYWSTHLRQTVRFSDGAAELLANREQVLLEVGPGNTLASLLQKQPESGGRCILSSVRHPLDNSSDTLFLQQTLGRLWLAGVSVDWPRIHATQTRHRVPLPTYPFQRERHMIEPQSEVDSIAARNATALQKNPDISDWFYVPSWRRSAPLRSTGKFSIDECWLVFLDGEGLGDQIVTRLRSMGQVVNTVRMGSEFSVVDNETFIVEPTAADSYDQLASELAANDHVPSRVLHLWNVSDSSAASNEEILRDNGFYSLLFAVQALLQRRGDDALQIDVISNETRNVTGAERLSADKATILGPGLVMRQEFPQVGCRNVDVDLNPSDAHVRQVLVSQLIAELMTESVESNIALRCGQRWVLDVAPVRLDNVASPVADGQAGIREGGVYLIVGGLGAIAQSLADFLAKNYRARLVLTGRSVLPPRNSWSDVLADAEPDDPIRSKIEAIQGLEAHGAEVLVLTADAADAEAMQKVFDTIDAKFGELHGVVYAAGLIGAESLTPMQELDRARCESQFRSKIYGLRVLASELAGRALDFCVVTSSLSSYLGGFGFSAYAAANIFMDAFVQRQNQSGGTQWITVNWEGWQASAAAAEFGGTHALAMTHDEGVQTFARLLAWPELETVIVSSADLRSRLALWVHNSPAPATRTGTASIATEQHRRPQLSSTFRAPETGIELAIAAIWEELLGIDGIGAEDNFFKLGGDSLLATRVVPRLRDGFNVEIQLRELFEEGTIAALAARVEDLLFEQIDALSDEEAERLVDSKRPAVDTDHD